MAGGDAADAAVSTAAALNVTEPCSTGIGGDCFSLYFDSATGKITALNGSGRSPAGLTRELVLGQGLAEGDTFRNPYHAHTVTVPGACAGWCDLVERHGTMPLATVLAPAIRLAEDGFPVSPITSYYWSRGAAAQLAISDGGRALTLDGRGPRPGEIFRNPGLARTLREVADGGAEAFYRGTIGSDIARAIQEQGGVMTREDLAAHRSRWEDPIGVGYRGMTIWECPPNGQGLAALLALAILDGMNVGREPFSSVNRWHTIIEAVRLGFADALACVADPEIAPAPLARLLSGAYAQKRRASIDPSHAALQTLPGSPLADAARPGSDTVYFCVVDGRGNACSFINSNYMGFGTGIVPSASQGRSKGESWGFSLQNRGLNFSLAPDLPNTLAPRKRPYHTIIPGMITRADGTLMGPFGVMGGFMQPQGHVQVVSALLDDRLDPQTALDRPRFYVDPSGAHPGVHIEEGTPTSVVEGLSARGHRVLPGIGGYDRSLFGRGQIITRNRDGVLCAGSDPRADGCAMGF